MGNDIFFFFFNLSQYQAVRDAALFLSYPMRFILPVALIIWIIVKAKRRWYTMALFSSAAISTLLITAGLKMLFKIPRPFLTLNLKPLFLESTYSFPSSHAAFFAVLAFVMFYINREIGILVMVLAFFVGLSRIVIGVHTPFDVFAGFCVGIVVGFICIKIFKRV